MHACMPFKNLKMLSLHSKLQICLIDCIKSLALNFFFILVSLQESSFTKLLRKTERNRPIRLWYESTYDARIAHESKTIHEGNKSAICRWMERTKIYHQLKLSWESLKLLNWILWEIKKRSNTEMSSFSSFICFNTPSSFTPNIYFLITTFFSSQKKGRRNQRAEWERWEQMWTVISTFSVDFNYIFSFSFFFGIWYMKGKQTSWKARKNERKEFHF